jgi:hypothetical protein
MEFRLIYRLLDETTGNEMGFYKTIQGVMKAMAAHVDSLAQPLHSDYEGAKSVKFKISYEVESIEVQD